ncbi:MAG: M4 family metallopeptidase [Hyalangium sp.]|uniref:M4 family metallopeptidase n=1 Tax=Hyalangium sp. TaxID=2028555 RepID=UPI00389A5404
MTIRRLDSPVVPPTTRNTDSQPTAAKNTATPSKSTMETAKSGFTPAAAPKTAAPDLSGGLRQAAAPGPVATTSPEGQAAINATLDFLNQHAPAGESLIRGGAPKFDASKNFVPRSVEKDELGMTHVRMDRTFEGTKVFGEQIIGHLDAQGKMDSVTGDTSTIPAGLGSKTLKLSDKDAMAVAQKAFGGKTDRQPTLERVVFQDDQGKYHAGYRAELTNTSDASQSPRKMNYLIDGDSGKIVQSFNQIGGFEKKPAATTPSAVTGTATPNADIKDNKTVTSKITIGDDVSIDKMKLNLDIDHTYRGDLVVTLTSPSGKSATISNREGGSADNIKGEFDMSQFAGESAKGDWTLTVSDKARGDSGKLNSWSLNITPKGSQPPPPPPPPTGTANDKTMYSGTVDLQTTKNADGTFSLNDSTRGKGVETRDTHNSDENQSPTPSSTTPFVDKNDAWGETGDDSRTKAAVDAHYGAEMTYDFYKNVLGRDSIDGKGEKLLSNVHLGTNFVNAFWDGQQMNYGDGDGKEAGPLTTLDIAGHEISHGLTERTAGLVYSGESGGLNEAMSDIMGTGVEWYASQKNSAVKFDYTVGEDAWTPNNGDPTDGLRDMSNPTADGYSLDNYKNFKSGTEVHSSSGIANNAFYLMAQGGTNKTSGMKVDSGIGIEKSLKIFGRALTTYMTPKTTFAQARDACIKSATDLYGANSPEVQTVQKAWSAVGVESKK